MASYTSTISQPTTNLAHYNDKSSSADDNLSISKQHNVCESDSASNLQRPPIRPQSVSPRLPACEEFPAKRKRNCNQHKKTPASTNLSQHTISTPEDTQLSVCAPIIQSPVAVNAEQPYERRKDLAFTPNMLGKDITKYSFVDCLKYLEKTDSPICPKSTRIKYLSDIIEKMETLGYYCGVTDSVAEENDEWLGRFIERETREQSSSDLWKTLRKSLLSASRMYPNLKTQKPIPYTIKMGTMDDCAASLYGLINEKSAKNILLKYYGNECPNLVIKPVLTEESDTLVIDDDDEASDFNTSMGLLLDMETGMYGASLDLLLCPRDNKGMLDFTAAEKLYFFEIKSKIKYTCDILDGSPLSSAMAAFCESASLEDFKRLVKETRVPVVQYVCDNTTSPSSTECLLSNDPSWAQNPRKRGKSAKDQPEFIKKFYKMNKDKTSTLIVFGCPDSKTSCIKEKAVHYNVPVFINSNHSHFSQILTQAYVVQTYPQAKQKPILPHLATLFTRRRTTDEVGKSIIDVSGKELDPRADIPVALLVTPVDVGSDFSCLTEFAELTWNHWLWEISAQNSAAPEETSCTQPHKQSH